MAGKKINFKHILIVIVIILIILFIITVWGVNQFMHVKPVPNVFFMIYNSLI